MPSRKPRAARMSAYVAAATLAGCLTVPRAAPAFCGFYVAKADSALFNDSSEVVLVRDKDRTVLTMSNDYQGELKEFALVVPVPVVLQKEQIHVGERKHVEHLDAFSAPRLVEYFDADPCMKHDMVAYGAVPAPAAAGAPMREMARAKALGVTIEARYTVGEYDILILSARESSGLETWLVENGYKLPPGASRALAPYIKQDLKFFVAKVNLKEQAKTGFNFLRPLQMAYESPRFMLPIRLGMVNARGPQDLVVYVLSREGRVETANYRTVKIPSDMDVPTYLKEDFGPFYKAMFETSWKKEGRNVALLEYFWDMSWCDPCAADPLSQDELRALGVFWVGGSDAGGSGAPLPRQGIAPSMRRPPGGAQNVLLTRLHVRYDAEHFPEDLTFQETKDRENFQARYVLRHPFTGESECDEAMAYRKGVRDRRENEIETAARLTGWDPAVIRKKMTALPAAWSAPTPEPTPESWWKGLWK